MICVLFLAAALFIRHGVYRHAQWAAASSAFSSNLDGLALISEEAGTEFLQFDSALSFLCEELESAAFGLYISRSLGAKDNPSHFDRRIFSLSEKAECRRSRFQYRRNEPRDKGYVRSALEAGQSQLFNRINRLDLRFERRLMPVCSARGFDWCDFVVGQTGLRQFGGN